MKTLIITDCRVAGRQVPDRAVMYKHELEDYRKEIAKKYEVETDKVRFEYDED